jgi:hypothetical protein
MARDRRILFSILFRGMPDLHDLYDTCIEDMVGSHNEEDHAGRSEEGQIGFETRRIMGGGQGPSRCFSFCFFFVPFFFSFPQVGNE